MLGRFGAWKAVIQFYMPFIPASVKGFFLWVISLFPSEVEFCFVLSTSFSMKLNYFPNFKLLLFGWNFFFFFKAFRVKNLTPVPKKNLTQALIFWIFKDVDLWSIQFLKLIICTIATTIPMHFPVLYRKLKKELSSKESSNLLSVQSSLNFLTDYLSFVYHLSEITKFLHLNFDLR